MSILSANTTADAWKDAALAAATLSETTLS